MHIFIVAALAAFTATFVAAAPSLSVGTTSSGEQCQDASSLKLFAHVTNTGDVPLKLFKDPKGVLSPFNANSFTISDANGNPPEFTGARFKWSPGQVMKIDNPESFVFLAPGKTTTVEHKLAGTYNFTTTGAGKYTFTPFNTFYYLDPETKAMERLEASIFESATVCLDGNLAHVRHSPIATRLTKRASFNGCTNAQESQIQDALGPASRYLVESTAYLAALTGSTPRYDTWFGTITAANRDLVHSHFSSVATSDPTTYTYDCSTCDQTDVYAFVYRNEFGTIYLCTLFWEAPLTGTDSKAGTIVHESTHFELNGGTRDLAYGQERCKALATSNPAQAVMNADSHEYFAENNPNLA